MEKNQEPEPEPLGKKSAAGAAKNKPAPQPCEKIKSIRKFYLSYSSLGKILSLMVKKTIILLVIYIFFCSFTLTSLREIEYFATEPEPVGAGCFWPLEPETLEKKTRSRSRSRFEKNQEPDPEPLEKRKETEPACMGESKRWHFKRSNTLRQ